MQSSSQNYKDHYDRRGEYDIGSANNYRHVYTHDANGSVVWYATTVPSWRDYYESSDAGANVGYAYVLRKPRNVRAMPYKPAPSQWRNYQDAPLRPSPSHGYSHALVRAQPSQPSPFEEEHGYAKSLSNAYRKAYYIRRQSTNPLYAAYKAPAENGYIYSAYCLNPRIVNVDKTQNTETNFPEMRDIACGNSQVHISSQVCKKAPAKKAKNFKKVKHALTAESSMETVMIEEIEYLEEDDSNLRNSQNLRMKPQSVTKEMMTETAEFACGDQFVEILTADSKNSPKIVCRCDDNTGEVENTERAEKLDIIPFSVQAFVFRCYMFIRKFINVLSRFLL